MSSSQAKPAATRPAYTRQSVIELSSLRRRPVIMSSKNRPLAPSSINGALIATEAKLTVSPALIAEATESSSTTDTTTAIDAPHRNASTSSRGGSGSQRSSHRYASRTRIIATVERTKPVAVPTGLTAVNRITISPVTVLSAISTPRGAPTLRILLGSPGLTCGCGGIDGKDTSEG